jgi:hypothetical protein
MVNPPTTPRLFPKSNWSKEWTPIKYLEKGIPKNQIMATNNEAK